jgi:hypothetical protein
MIPGKMSVFVSQTLAILKIIVHKLNDTQFLEDSMHVI